MTPDLYLDATAEISADLRGAIGLDAFRGGRG